MQSSADECLLGMLNRQYRKRGWRGVSEGENGRDEEKENNINIASWGMMKSLVTL